MTEFKILDNGIELFYSNLLLLNDGEYQVTVRAERYNSDMFRYEGLDVILPSGDIENIEFLKNSQIDEFRKSVLDNKEEILKLAKKDSILLDEDEGDNMIELSSDSLEKISETNDAKEQEQVLFAGIDMKEGKSFEKFISSEKLEGEVVIKEKPSFFQKLLNKIF